MKNCVAQINILPVIVTVTRGLTFTNVTVTRGLTFTNVTVTRGLTFTNVTVTRGFTFTNMATHWHPACGLLCHLKLVAFRTLVAFHRLVAFQSSDADWWLRSRSRSRIVYLNTSYKKAHALPPSCPDCHQRLRRPVQVELPRMKFCLSQTAHIACSWGSEQARLT